jgi:hypothetical protein
MTEVGHFYFFTFFTFQAWLSPTARPESASPAVAALTLYLY